MPATHVLTNTLQFRYTHISNRYVVWLSVECKHWITASYREITMLTDIRAIFARPRRLKRSLSNNEVRQQQTCYCRYNKYTYRESISYKIACSVLVSYYCMLFGLVNSHTYFSYCQLKYLFNVSICQQVVVLQCWPWCPQEFVSSCKYPCTVCRSGTGNSSIEC